MRSDELLAQFLQVARAFVNLEDPQALLEGLLLAMRRMTQSDAGSIYVVERLRSRRVIRFKAAQNDSVRVDLDEFTIPVDSRSIVGSAVLRRTAINVRDLYDPSCEWYSKHNRKVDQTLGYETRSVLTIPLTSRDGDVIGVIQLINKKREPGVLLKSHEDFEYQVLPFDEEEVRLAEALGGLAGILLENTSLYAELHRLFLGLIETIVAAVDSRDPVTAGHSERVAKLAVALARAVDSCTEGRFRDVHFTKEQLEALHVAALLHDIGKLGVPESILTKETRLPRDYYLRLMERFDTIHMWLRLEGRDEEIPFLERLRNVVQEVNVPVPVDDEAVAILEEARRRTYVNPRGEERPWLTGEEYEYLTVRRGNLTSWEREVMNSHVLVGYDILENVPWMKGMEDVPSWVVSHHEKLDGSGYPHGKRDIPLMGRILAVVDIYDALRATDRPYKRPMSLEQARRILEGEAEAGRLDPDLVHLLFDKEVHSTVQY